MILENMNDKEICDAFHNDRLQIENRLDKLDWKKYERYLKKNKSKGPIFFEPVRFKSKNSNDYIIIPFSPGWKDSKRENVAIIHYMYYRRAEGFYAVSHTLRFYYRYTIYPPHFFQRYQERFLHQPELSQQKTIEMFFKRTLGTANADKLDDNKYQLSCTDGVILGIEDMPGILVAKTFVSVDMLKGKQIDRNKNRNAILRDFLEAEFRTKI